MLLGLALTGCADALASLSHLEATVAPPSAVAKAKPERAPAAAPAQPAQIDSAKLASEGLKYLAAGDGDRARRLFSAAIKFNPSNGYYHLLLGVSLHLQYRSIGSPDLRDQAMTGYQVAARLLPGDYRPSLQMGRLYLDSKQYAESGKAFSEGLELKPADPDLLYGLATASFLQGDIKTALWSADELSKIGWNPPAVDRMRAILFAAVGDHTLSARYRDAYADKLKGGGRELVEFDNRLGEIKSMVDSRAWLQRPGETAAASGLLRDAVLTATTSGLDANRASAGAAGSIQLAQANTPAPMGAPPGAMPPPFPAAMGSPPPAASTPPAVPGASAKPWFSCVDGVAVGGIPGAPGGGSPAGMPAMPTAGAAGAAAADETQALQALPAPCVGAPMPRMAVIDAVMLRTEDEVDHSFGVNVMQGLSGFFGFIETRTGHDLSVLSQSVTDGVGLNPSASSSPTATPLQYSLNIANATDNRNEVLARPTLLAIDRVPSTFFSGSTISVAVGGGAAGAVSQLVDKQVGVSFSITPTFIDDDHVMLSIKAARSFIEPPAAGTTGVQLEASRNAVSASLVAAFGDTVVLSGLTERELVRGRSGVPALKDIPGIQYMFATDSSTDFFRTIMIMVTIRKPVVTEADVAAVHREAAERARLGVPQSKKYAFYWRIEEYEKTLSKYAPNLDTALDTLDANRLYLNFKSADLKDTDWATASKLANLAHDMSLLAYH